MGGYGDRSASGFARGSVATSAKTPLRSQEAGSTSGFAQYLAAAARKNPLRNEETKYKYIFQYKRDKLGGWEKSDHHAALDTKRQGRSPSPVQVKKVAFINKADRLVRHEIATQALSWKRQYDSYCRFDGQRTSIMWIWKTSLAVARRGSWTSRTLVSKR